MLAGRLGLCHLVDLELCARLLAVGGVLRDDAPLHGLVQAGDEIPELLLGVFLRARVGGLEELLVRIVQLRLADRIALAGLLVLAIAFPGGSAALDICHLSLSFFWECSRVLYSFLPPKIKSPVEFHDFRPHSPPRFGAGSCPLGLVARVCAPAPKTTSLVQPTMPRLISLAANIAPPSPANPRVLTRGTSPPLRSQRTSTASRP